MTNEKYQGWSNYETWLVALWLDNDEYAQELAQKEASQYDTLSEDDNASWEDSNNFKDFVIDTLICNCDELGGFIQDLVNATLGEVDYSELIHHFQDNE